jgi:hypothetical protein
VQVDLVIRKQGNSGAYTITCDLAERQVFGRSIVSPVNLEGFDISREHFALFLRHGDICIQDLSSNGTVVNGEPVPLQKPQKLSTGDVISVPGYEIEVARRPSGQANRRPQGFVTPVPSRPSAGSFTIWEIVVIAAAIGSFVLILFYLLAL